MLRWRLSLGVLIVGILVVLFWLDITTTGAGMLLFPLALLLTPLAAGEMIRLTTVRNQQPLVWTVQAGSFLVVAVTGIPYLMPGYPADCPLGHLGWPLLGLVAAVLLAILGEIFRYERAEGVVVNLALAVYSIFYVGLMLSFVVQLRFVGDPDWKGLPLISMLVVVKFCDIGAYTIGRLIGKHKLAPKLSPAKTIEGAVGGLLFAIAGSWLALAVMVPWMRLNVQDVPWPAVVSYGLLIGAVGIVGDLAESVLKRDSGHKDSSSWMPGFGGVLDLLDSPLLAAPVAYVFWTLVLLGG